MKTNHIRVGKKAIVLTHILIILLVWPVCSFADKYSGGDGSAEHPYKIATPNDLNDIGNHPEDLDKYFELVNDINLAAYTGTEFKMVGDRYNDFNGIFDGNGYTIYNFSWVSSNIDEDYIGLFGRLESNGKIRNLNLENVDINVSDNSNFIGGLVGFNYFGSIFNCSSSGSVKGVSHVGGLVGFNDGTISCCHSSCVVYESSSLISSFSGGLVGTNYFGTITSSYATGNVFGTESVGGLVGVNINEIIYSYSKGDINGTSNIGGLVGENRYRIIESYTAGKVTGNQAFGGLVGKSGLWSTIRKSFWNIDVNPDMNGIGNGSDPNVIGKTTAEMQTESTFTNAGWDFVGETINGPNDIWTIKEGVKYPEHVWKLVNFVGWDGVDFRDYDYFAGWWMETDCNDVNDCNGVDLDFSNMVDYNDLDIFCNYWLVGK